MLQSNDCGCVIYECIINGEGAITWKGSAFECIGTDNEQLLTLLGTDKSLECNDGTVKAQRKNNYTSLLIITNSSLSGSNIECVHENGTNLNVIGNQSLSNISESSGRYSCQGDGHNDNCRICSNCRIT